jgi:2-hydroxychromene-2-carboxylate isomerase
MPKVRFFYDIACPYAYLASTQIEAIVGSQGAELEWKPILLGGLYRSVGGKDHPASKWPASKILHNERDMARQAELFGVPLDRPACYPQRTVNTMRLLLAAPESVRPALSHRLYKAYWVEGLAVGEREVLQGIAAEFGLDIACIDGPEIKEALFGATDEAKGLGMFGVPSTQVGQTFYWGADRLDFVLRDLSNTPMIQKWPNPSPPNQELVFYHDFSSPFSYLASTQIERIAKRHCAKLVYKPILLGALFKAIGTPNVPLFEMNPARQAYQRRDLLDWAEWWGVRLEFPKVFPIRTVAALRVALQAPETTSLLYRAAWAEGVDIGDTELLSALLDRNGFNGEELLAGTQDPEIKAQLFANTQEAIDGEVCGVPSMRVNGKTLFWGQDRLRMVEMALDGWEPREG